MDDTSSTAPADADRPPLRHRTFKGEDGSTLSFAESDDRSGWDVIAAVAGEAPVVVRISKGEGRTFARFLNKR